LVAPEFSFTVGKADEGERLDVWLARQGLPYSRSQIRRRIEEGEVRIAGQAAKPARKLHAGERVLFVPPPPVEVDDRPEDIPLAILYEDDHLVVLDKPAGMVVHPATSNQSGTLVNALLHHCGDSLTGVGGERRPGIVHRLDKDTSGVMIVAKSEPVLVALQALFHEHHLTRRYLAIVEGVIAERGVFKTKHGRDPHDRKKFSSKVESGRRAVTHWTVVERLRGATLIEVRLETGRTHQIRVHFKDAGHPVLGDRTYARPPRDARLRAIAAELGRQALHAHVLGLEHPILKKYMEWRSPPPADFARALERLKSEA
jgi:23S rRNA pseudouridine1911/1915/1917 synthase